MDIAEIADIMHGVWSGVPHAAVEAIRHRIDYIEDGLKNFLYAPQLFSKQDGTVARAAMFTVKEALAKGAIGIIASARPRNLDPKFPCLLVPNVSEAIGRLARYNRKQSKAFFFAVTGSVGKSTTRNMIHWLVASAGPAHRSIANYNDGIESIHFTLANLSPDDIYAVAEFSEVGHLEEQAKMYRPQVAVITNIAWEHINRMERQGYVGEQAIRRLAYLAAGLTRHMQPGGICVLNADEPNFNILAEEVQKSSGVRIATFGQDASNDVRIIAMTHDATASNISLQIEGQPYSYRLGMVGKHMAVNSVAAITAAHVAAIPVAQLLGLFSTFTADSLRGNYVQIPWADGHIKVRNETISSSIPSLRSSLAQLALELPEQGGRRIAILGQINGLGHTMPEAMADFAREADGSSVDRFYTIGSDIRIFNEKITDRSRVAPHFQTLAQLERTLREELRSGDIVVIKGTPTPTNISLRRLPNRLVSSAIPAQFGKETFLQPVKRMVIGGDTYLGESYQEKRAKLADLNYLAAFGYDYSGAQLAPLLRRADFTIINLECALTELPASKLEGRKGYTLRGKAHETIGALKNLNVTGVLLGNNHSMDYLEDGLQNTLDQISHAGIAITGAGRNRMEAQKAILKEFDIDGIPFKIAILSGYEYNNAHEKFGFYAGAEKAGVNNINVDRMKQQIAGLRSEGYFVIVSPHWGLNYCFRTHAQSRLARQFVDLGADLILGHGPHMMNEIAQIDGVWVVYSLGNLIFNSEGEYERRAVQPYSCIAELEFARGASVIEASLNLYPIVSCNQMTQFQPTFVDHHQFEQVVEMLKAMNYDEDNFFNNIALRKIDERHCMSMKLF